MLTKSFLQSMANELIFATGIIHDERLWRDPVRWVAKRGNGYPDWAIYYHHADKSPEWVAMNGDKVTSDTVIKELVSCDDEAFEMYRK